MSKGKPPGIAGRAVQPNRPNTQEDLVFNAEDDSTTDGALWRVVAINAGGLQISPGPSYEHRRRTYVREWIRANIRRLSHLGCVRFFVVRGQSVHAYIEVDSGGRMCVRVVEPPRLKEIESRIIYSQ